MEFLTWDGWDDGIGSEVKFLSTYGGRGDLCSVLAPFSSVNYTPFHPVSSTLIAFLV